MEKQFFENKVRNSLAECLRKDSKSLEQIHTLACAVSGGADSIAMLSALKVITKNTKVRLLCVNVNRLLEIPNLSRNSAGLLGLIFFTMKLSLIKLKEYVMNQKEVWKMLLGKSGMIFFMNSLKKSMLTIFVSPIILMTRQRLC